MFNAQVICTIVYFFIIVFNVINLYRLITSKSQTMADLRTKIMITKQNTKVLMFSSILNILLIFVSIFSIWSKYRILFSIINLIFIINISITRYVLYRLK